MLAIFLYSNVQNASEQKRISYPRIKWILTVKTEN